MVFFKGRDADAVAQAFKEFVYGNEKRKGRTSVREKLKRLDITWMKADFGAEDYTLAELLDMIKEKSNNIAKAVAELETLIGEVEE